MGMRRLRAWLPVPLARQTPALLSAGLLPCDDAVARDVAGPSRSTDDNIHPKAPVHPSIAGDFLVQL
jgi:hypothetical protein